MDTVDNFTSTISTDEDCLRQSERVVPRYMDYSNVLFVLSEVPGLTDLSNGLKAAAG